MNQILLYEFTGTLSKKLSIFPRYNIKCRGKRDTTWNIPRSITFSPLHFMLYRGKSIFFWDSAYPWIGIQIGPKFRISTGSNNNVRIENCISKIVLWVHDEPVVLVINKWGTRNDTKTIGTSHISVPCIDNKTVANVLKVKWADCDQCYFRMLFFWSYVRK